MRMTEASLTTFSGICSDALLRPSRIVNRERANFLERWSAKKFEYPDIPIVGVVNHLLFDRSISRISFQWFVVRLHHRWVSSVSFRNKGLPDGGKRQREVLLISRITFSIRGLSASRRAWDWSRAPPHWYYAGRENVESLFAKKI